MCEMLSNQMGNQHLGFLQYSYDLPTYGIVVDYITKWYWSCTCCAFATTGQWSNVLRKVVYCGQHRRCLPHSHLYHPNARTFGGIEEVTPPTKSDVDDVCICCSSNKGGMALKWKVICTNWPCHTNWNHKVECTISAWILEGKKFC
jgi:hypothetical protein